MATQTPTTDEPDDAADEEPTLQARLELLERENRRLREEYVAARKTSYRRTALGFLAVGILGLLAGALFPVARAPLLIIGAIGLFGGLLTYYLTPERFVAGETGERIYAGPSDTLADLTSQLGLEDTTVYVPTEDHPARLFVPQQTEYLIPDEDVAGPIVVTDTPAERGLLTIPTGAYLYREFSRTTTAPMEGDISTTLDQLAEGLVEAFELVETVETDLDRDDGRATVRVEDALYGTASFDQPSLSFLAVGLASAIDTPVEAVAHETEEGQIIELTWAAPADEEDDTEENADDLASEEPADG